MIRSILFMLFWGTTMLAYAESNVESLQKLRFWTSTNGSRVLAKFIRFDNGWLIFQNLEGGQFIVRTDTLSSDDLKLLVKAGVLTRQAANIPETEPLETTSQKDQKIKTTHTSTGKEQVSIQLSNGAEMTLEYGGEYIYGTIPTSSEEEIEVTSALYQQIRLYGKDTIENKIAKSNGATFKVQYQCLTPDIASISDTGAINWHKEGEATFKISAFSLDGDNALGEITLHVHVVRLPISVGMTSTELVSVLGFPDQKLQKTFDWYNTHAIFDGVFYYLNSTEGEDTTIVHYSYDKYPKLRIRIAPFQSGEPVMSVRTQGWN